MSELVIGHCPRATPFGLEPHVTVADGQHRYFIGVFIGNDVANLTIETRKPSPVTAWGRVTISVRAWLDVNVDLVNATTKFGKWHSSAEGTD